MAVLRTEYKAILIQDEKDGDAIGYFKEPTNEQWNVYQKERFIIKTKGKKIVSNQSNDVTAKANLFDKIVVKVENLKDEHGKEMGMEQVKKLLPNRVKAEAIFTIFEQEGVEEIADGESARKN